MTNKQVRVHIEESIPFTLHLADGRSFDVPHQDFIFCHPKNTVLTLVEIDDEDEAINHTIPLLMISGISHLEVSNT